jgi:adenylate cyclase
MATTTATRRLAAILAADVVGYSRLMGADEEGTHERLRAHLRELVDPKIVEHRGRTVKNTGDGLLAEFPSVVDAVRCAVEVQRGMVDRESEEREERRIRLRIGVNLGDVIVDGGDIYGDGVNIAARLEGLAAPGGICVSGTVRDHIGDRLPYRFEDMGEQSVKNIARPVRAYSLRPEGAATQLPPGSPTRRSGRARTVIGTVVAAVLVVVCVAWWFWPTPMFLFRAGKPTDQATASATPMPATPAATSISQPLVAPRLSIVVLPFANLSDDPEQQYFADGIIEDLTTDLSRVADMFVISRNTAFSYRNKPINTKQIGRELGVRYVLAQPPRSNPGILVSTNRAGASAAVAHGRGDRLARKSARRLAGSPRHPRPDRFRLRPRRRDRTRIRGTRRSPQAECRRSLLKPRPFEGRRLLRVPKIRALFEATNFAGLRKAGMPEE